MNKKIYLETSFISYLLSKPNRDLIITAHQQITREWWGKRKNEFSLFISQLVYEECIRGDAGAASERLKIIERIPLLELNKSAISLAKHLVNKGNIPEKSVEDALHIAVATVHGMDYLLTWNCKHIANASNRRIIETRCNEFGYEVPTICTPEELMEK